MELIRFVGRVAAFVRPTAALVLAVTCAAFSWSHGAAALPTDDVVQFDRIEVRFQRDYGLGVWDDPVENARVVRRVFRDVLSAASAASPDSKGGVPAATTPGEVFRNVEIPGLARSGTTLVAAEFVVDPKPISALVGELAGSDREWMQTLRVVGLQASAVRRIVAEMTLLVAKEGVQGDAVPTDGTRAVAKLAGQVANRLRILLPWAEPDDKKRPVKILQMEDVLVKDLAWTPGTPLRKSDGTSTGKYPVDGNRLGALASYGSADRSAVEQVVVTLREFTERTLEQPVGGAARGAATRTVWPEIWVRSKGTERSSEGDTALIFEVAFIGPKSARDGDVDAMAVDQIELSYDVPPGVFAEGEKGEAERAAYLNSGKGGNLPDPAEVIAHTEVELAEVSDAGGHSFLVDDDVAPPGAKTVKFRLNEIPAGSRLTVSALRVVIEQVLHTLKSREDLLGVIVELGPNQLDLEALGWALNPEGARTLKLIAIPAIVNQVRTIDGGDPSRNNLWAFLYDLITHKKPSADELAEDAGRINLPSQARFRERSPIQPGDPQTATLRRRTLEDYLARQSRNPNRRVDAVVVPAAVRATEGQEAPAGSAADAPDAASSAAAQKADIETPSGFASNYPGTVGIDYLVTQSKPWMVYGQVSNTGTESTNKWVERVGFQNTDLLGNDEYLSIEYLTNSFDATNALVGYFEAPVGKSEVLRWRVTGDWLDYTASDVGFARAQFDGTSWGAGADLTYNFAQFGRLFLDAVAGARYFDIRVTDTFLDSTGDQAFLTPYVGLRASEVSRLATTDCVVNFRFDTPGATGVSADELTLLGRLFPDEQFYILDWDLYQSFYIDQWFQRSNEQPTLAHEIAARFKGQYSFDTRLIPQEMAVLGGLYSVRGYPQSIVSGDSAVVLNLEYRLHVAQLFGVDADPKPLLEVGQPFRMRPQFGYGGTDWGFMVRAFYDVGRVFYAQPLSYEQDQTLMGAGLGVEFQFFQNLNLRVDWGVALQSVPGLVDAGDSQVYFVGTISF